MVYCTLHAQTRHQSDLEAIAYTMLSMLSSVVVACEGCLVFFEWYLCVFMPVVLQGSERVSGQYIKQHACIYEASETFAYSMLSMLSAVVVACEGSMVFFELYL